MTGHAHEPHIVCPKCSHQFPLTESIAAPLLEAERQEFRQKLAGREAEFARKADELRRQQDELARASLSIVYEFCLRKRLTRRPKAKCVVSVVLSISGSARTA